MSSKGAGVEVFQPFEAQVGELTLVSSSSVDDGDKKLTIRIESLQTDQQASFTIDVDDTLDNSSLGQIRVTGSEIQGGTVSVSTPESEPLSAGFNANSRASITMEFCS